MNGSGLGLLLALLAAVPPVSAEPVIFIAIGDQPYTDNRLPTPDWQYRKFETEITPAVRASGAAFVVHYGDFRSGGAPCSLVGIKRAHEQMMALLDGPLWLTRCRQLASVRDPRGAIALAGAFALRASTTPAIELKRKS